jgi:hypothetical protein
MKSEFLKKICVNSGFQVSAPCDYYSRTEITRDDTDYFITIFIRNDGEPCLDARDTIQVFNPVDVTSGEKTFHFWYSDTASPDTTIKPVPCRGK